MDVSHRLRTTSECVGVTRRHHHHLHHQRRRRPSGGYLPPLSRLLLWTVTANSRLAASPPVALTTIISSQSVAEERKVAARDSSADNSTKMACIRVTSSIQTKTKLRGHAEEVAIWRCRAMHVEQEPTTLGGGDCSHRRSACAEAANGHAAPYGHLDSCKGSSSNGLPCPRNHNSAPFFSPKILNNSSCERVQQ